MTDATYEDPAVQAALARVRAFDPEAERVLQTVLTDMHGTILAYERNNEAAVVVRSVSRIAVAMQQSTEATVRASDANVRAIDRASGAMEAATSAMTRTSQQFEVLVQDHLEDRKLDRERRRKEFEAEAARSGSYTASELEAAKTVREGQLEAAKAVRTLQERVVLAVISIVATVVTAITGYAVGHAVGTAPPEPTALTAPADP